MGYSIHALRQSAGGIRLSTPGTETYDEILRLTIHGSQPVEQAADVHLITGEVPTDRMSINGDLHSI